MIVRWMMSCFWAGAMLASGQLVISEFMASNETTLADEDGDFSDWIEIWNPDDASVDLAGYHLTDKALELTKWKFPSVILGPGDYLIVFASDKKRTDGELHTNFKLAAGGEYLGLVAPDGMTVISDFGERYPQQVEDQSFGRGDFGVGYFDEASPREVNGSGRVQGPLFLEFRSGGESPLPDESLEITARVEGAVAVILFHRRGFEAEEVVEMSSDDGVNFTATIAGGAAGELLRWRFVAEDADGFASREPLFADPRDSHEYHGVVVQDPERQTRAEVLEWFITEADANRLDSFQPVRAGISFKGEYYDNVEFSVRGQSTLFFEKKAYAIDFNKTQRFLWREGEPRVRDIELLTNWGDKAKVRNELAFGLLRDAGVPTHFAFTVRVEQNGEFFSLADFVEDADELYLSRAGLPEGGTLYKARSTLLSPDDLGDARVVKKMTRKDEGLADFEELIRGLNQDEATSLDYLFDAVDLPTTINALAGLAVIMQTDMGRKNHYLFHDTEGDGQWSILPWDLDLTFGRNFTRLEGYFNNELFTADYTQFEVNNHSRLVELIVRGNPRTREMYFGRLRTLADQFLASDYLDERLEAQLDRLSPRDLSPGDALLDSLKWGTWLNGSPVPQPWSSQGANAESMEVAVDRIRNEWLPQRRFEIFQNVPDLPPALMSPVVEIGGFEYDPISDDQDQEYVELINQSPQAVDVSGWSLRGAIRLLLPPGTVIPAGESLFVSPDVRAFQRRDFSPRGGEQRFVVGPYEGRLNAEGETFEIADANGMVQDRLTYSGNRPGFNGDDREDRDGDGLNALMEWALGSSDELVNALPLPEEGVLRYFVRRDLNDYVLRTEVSVDLENWTSEGLVESSRLAVDDIRDEVVVDLPPDAPRLFLRYRLARE